MVFGNFDALWFLDADTGGMVTMLNTSDKSIFGMKLRHSVARFAACVLTVSLLALQPATSSSGRSTGATSRRRRRSARARVRVGSVCMLVSICTLCCTVRRCCSHGSHLCARRYQDGHRYFAEDLCAITVLRQAGELPPVHCPRLSIPAPAFLHTSQPTPCVHRENRWMCASAASNHPSAAISTCITHLLPFLLPSVPFRLHPHALPPFHLHHHGHFQQCPNLI